jgi:hypothetical protein
VLPGKLRGLLQLADKRLGLIVAGELITLRQVSRCGLPEIAFNSGADSAIHYG